MTPRTPPRLLARPTTLLGLLALCVLPVATACGAGDAGDAGVEGADGARVDESAVRVEGASAVAGSLEIRDAVVTEPVTGERAALYLTVADVSGAGDVLLGVDALGAGSGSLHRTEQVGDGSGRMTMRPVDSLVVQAGDRLLLRPGGIHGMLEELESAWTAGDTVAVTLRFRGAGAVALRTPVVAYGELDRLFPPGSGQGG